MEKRIDLHFYHGFLGGSQDWNQVIEFLTDDYSIWRNDLVQTFSQQAGQLTHGQNYLEMWGHWESLLWGEKHRKRILVGYSLGGRLLMHIEPRHYDAIIFLSAHPGLLKGKEQRLNKDKTLAENMKKTQWNEWINVWNTQPIFKHDRLRPDRSNQEVYQNQWAGIMQACSLGLQEAKDSFFHENKDKITWVYGERDAKYCSLAERIKSLIGEERVEMVEGVGHGVLFDRPKRIAEIVEKVVSSVE